MRSYCSEYSISGILISLVGAKKLQLDIFSDAKLEARRDERKASDVLVLGERKCPRTIIIVNADECKQRNLHTKGRRVGESSSLSVLF
jgi:hypothetical protein